MPASARLPSDSGWEKLKGPATGNTPDAGLAEVPKDKPMSKFEAVSPKSVQSYVKPGERIHGQEFAERGHSNREVQAEHGPGPSFEAQAASRGIKPADFGSVRANAPNARVSHGNQNPVRGKGGKTPPAEEMVKKGLD